MTPLDWTVPLTLGFVSSLHCTQMCGPMVLAYSLPLPRAAGFRRALPHLAYNAGRLLTYTLLGAVAGVLGGGITTLGRVSGFERAAVIAVGAAMILAGVLISGWLPRSGLVRIGTGIPGVFSRLVGPLLKSGGARAKFALGVILGFLPCGMVYATLLKAVHAGTPLAGAATMLLFGLGTSAALLAIGLFSSVLARRLGPYANTLASVSFLLLGAYLLFRGLMAGAPRCH
jgi:uncharacterized protein